jgi:hypothetical protein
MRDDWQTSRTVDLDYDQLMVLEDRPGTRVRVLYGQLWLTEEGRAQDLFIGSGGEVALRGRGRAVLEGLGRARVQLLSPSSRRSRRAALAAVAAVALSVARMLRGVGRRLAAAAEGGRHA